MSQKQDSINRIISENYRNDTIPMGANIELSKFIAADSILIDTHYYDNKKIKCTHEYNLMFQKHGKSKWFLENGTVMIELMYINDVSRGICRWNYPDGSKKVEGNLINKRRVGKFTTYYPSGIVQKEQNYRNGHLHGLFTRYHKNGKIEFQASFKNGKSYGLRKYYDENGNPQNGEHKYMFDGWLFFVSHCENGLPDGEFKVYIRKRLEVKGTYEKGYLKTRIDYSEPPDSRIEIYENGTFLRYGEWTGYH